MLAPAFSDYRLRRTRGRYSLYPCPTLTLPPAISPTVCGLPERSLTWAERKSRPLSPSASARRVSTARVPLLEAL